jgi:hypothetical protein
MAAASSAIDDFRRELGEYNTLHVGFPDQYSKFIEDIGDIEKESVTATNLPRDTISRVVEKIAKYEELRQKLKDVVSPRIQNVLQHIQDNNSNLARLKLEIETAITSAQLAAEKKADDEAKTAAAEKAALDKARAIIDKEIAHLRQFKTDLRQQFEKTLSDKNLEVTRLNKEITSKNAEIKSKLVSDPNISDETRAIVKGITDDISIFIVANDFTPISADINTRGLETLAKFDAIIENLQQVKDGTDIDAMTDAVTPVKRAIVAPSMELDKIIKEEPDEFIKKLQAKRDDVLSNAEKKVTAAIQRDSDIADMLREATELIKSVEVPKDPKYPKDPKSKNLFRVKLADAQDVVEKNNPEQNKSSNILLGSLLGNSKSSLELFGRQVKEMTEKFEKIKTDAGKLGIAVSTKQSELKNTIDVLNRLYQDEKAKYKSLHDKFEANILNGFASQERLSPANSVSSTSSVSQSVSPSPSSIPSPIKGNPLAIIPAPPLSLKRPDSRSSFTGAAAGQVKDAWNSSLRSLSPPPRLQQSTESTSPDRQSTALVGPRQHLIFIPRSQKGTPSDAYLVEIPTDDGGLSSPKSIDWAGAGGKRKHLQRGGAPPPVFLPAKSEIRIVNVYNPGLADLISGLTSPNKLLHDTSEENPDHPTIAKIRTGIPIVDQNEKEGIYRQIRQFLITKESRSPLDIGRKAVYKVNILDLLRLLDKQLGKGGQYRVMYQELWTFMEYKFGTFGVLKSLFEATFNRPNSPRSSSSPPPLDFEAVFKAHDIKKIVGWNSKPKPPKNELFDKLFDMFSIKCKNGFKSTFLSNDDPSSQKNLGSKQQFYYRFRLNWIILLAFHSEYTGHSRLDDVGELIRNMHDAFLGWMRREKDTFNRMFFPDDSNSVNSRVTYSTRVETIINDTIRNAPSLSDTVATIKKKICELQDNTAEVTVIDPDVGEEEDPDYRPSDDDDDDDDGSEPLDSGETSPRSTLSSAGDLSTSARFRNVSSLRPRPPSIPQLNIPRPSSSTVLLDLGEQPRVTSKFIKEARDKVGILTLPDVIEDLDPRVPFRSGERKPPVSNAFLLDSARAAEADAAAPVTSRTFPGEFRSISQSRSIIPAEPELWAEKVPERRPVPPGAQKGEHIRQEKSRPHSASSSGNNTSTNSVQGSDQGSVQGSDQGSDRDPGWFTYRRNKVYPSPIVGATNPAWKESNREHRTLPLTHKIKKTQVAPALSEGRFGGSHKKRTRKHKKQISRHPTRRRRIAKPTQSEGHKYTRKRSRT